MRRRRRLHGVPPPVAEMSQLIRNADGAVTVTHLGRSWGPLVTFNADGTTGVAAPSYPASFGWRLLGAPTWTVSDMASGPATLPTTGGQQIEIETYGATAFLGEAISDGHLDFSHHANSGLFIWVL